MANEKVDELSEQLKAVASSLEDIGTYSKNLSAAITETSRPMQQMSDLAKAIQDSMGKFSTDMTSTKDAMSMMSKSMAEMTREMGKMSEVKLLPEMQKYREEQEKSKAAILEIKRLKEASALEERREWARTSQELKEKHDAIERMASAWDKAKRSVREWQTELAKKHPTAASSMSTGAQALTGAADLQGGISAITGAMSSLALVAGGVGGLIGMFLHGKMREAEFAAIGHTAAQQFAAIGGATEGFVARMSRASRSLSVMGSANKEDLALVAKAFAETGVAAKDAEATIEGFSAVGMSSLVLASLAADKQLELTAGTMARMSGTLARDFNMSAKDAFINLQNMGTAAKNSGLNIAVFMQQATEAASAMRLLNANTEAVFQTQLVMAQSMQQSGFGSAFSGAYAARGTANVTGAVANMQEGIAAIIGQRLMPGTSGIDALYAMKSPMGRSTDQQLDITDIMKEMRDIVDQMGGSRGEKAFALTKVMGVDYSGADTILDALDEINTTGKISGETQKALNGAFQDEAEKINALTRIVEQIRNTIAETVVGLLDLVVSSLKLIYNGVMFSAYTMAKTASLGDRSKLYGGLADIYSEKMSTNLSDMGTQADTVSKGAREVVGLLKHGADQLGLAPKDDEFDKREKLIKQQLSQLDSKEDPQARAARWEQTRRKKEREILEGLGLIDPIVAVPNAMPGSAGPYQDLANAAKKVADIESARGSAGKTTPRRGNRGN